MAKRTFDTAITADIRSVAGDSFKDSIRMLEIGKLRASEENFYSMSYHTARPFPMLLQARNGQQNDISRAIAP